MSNLKSVIKEVIEPNKFKVGDEVQLVIVGKTDLGFKATVNNEYYGVLYYNEVFEELRVGDELPGYVKVIRPDNKLDLTIYKEGSKGSEDIAERILEVLTKSGGALSVNSKTTPEFIYKTFGVSKKKFKMAVGLLYKKRIIEISEKEIRLAKSV